MVWLADETVEIEVATFDKPMREHAGNYMLRVIAGTGLPPMTCRDIPEIKAGFAPVRNDSDDGWDYLPDHRGTIVWDKSNAEKSEISELGDIPESKTPIEPPFPYPKWVNVKWVNDDVKQKQVEVSQADTKKTVFIAEASKEIAILADAVEFDMATPEEVARYNALRKYRVELNRVDTSTAPDIAWPQKP